MHICFSFIAFTGGGNNIKLITELSVISYQKDFKLLKRYQEICFNGMIHIYSRDIGHNQFQHLSIARWLSLNLRSLIMILIAHRIVFGRINLHPAARMRHLDLDWMMLLNLRSRQPFLRRVEAVRIVFGVERGCSLSLGREYLRRSYRIKILQIFKIFKIFKIFNIYNGIPPTI